MIDSSGAVRMEWVSLSPMYTFRLNGTGEHSAHAIDATGNVFIEYDPGRYLGVIVLRPTLDGFDDFRSLPVDDSGVGGFYSAGTVDVEGDGIYEIAVLQNDCVPDCAGGTMVETDYWWVGSTYEIGG